MATWRDSYWVMELTNGPIDALLAAGTELASHTHQIKRKKNRWVELKKERLRRSNGYSVTH